MNEGPYAGDLELERGGDDVPPTVVILPASEVESARRLAESQGVSVREVPGLGFEPVATVTLLLLGATAATAAVIQQLEQRKGGQVIDLRHGAPKAIYRTADVVYGTVVVIASDGSVTVEVKEPTNIFGKVIEALPQALTSLVGASADAVAAQISEELGDGAVVHKRILD